eukprot:353045-Chlamydomonas_euryale.AAC.5
MLRACGSCESSEGVAAHAGCHSGQRVVLDGAGSGDVATAYEEVAVILLLIALLWSLLCSGLPRVSNSAMWKVVASSWPCLAPVHSLLCAR